MLARDQVGRALLAEVDAILLGSFKDLVRRLVAAGGELTPRQSERLAALFRSTGDLLADRYGTINNTITVALQEFSGIEAAIARQEIANRVGHHGRVAAAFGGLDPQRIVGIADVFLEGQRLPDWWRDQARKMNAEVRRQIQIGLTQGQSVTEIVKRITPARGTVSATVYARARREADTLVRTAVTAVAAKTQLESWRRMDRTIADSYEWVAIRDARTSVICIALDGQEFRLDDPNAPVPPAHFRCRSIIRLVMKGVPRPAPGGWRTYEDWLKTQPENVQRRILGASRWDLWRRGKITLRDLINSDQRVLPLAKLRELAGVDDTPLGGSPLPAVPVPAAVSPASRVVVLAGQETTYQALVDRTMEASGSVHLVPDSAARVVVGGLIDSAQPGQLGAYYPAINRIGLAKRGRVPTTLIHEFGHYLDAQAFGVLDRRQGVATGHWRTAFQSYRTPPTPAWKDLREAIRESAHYAHWNSPDRHPGQRRYMTMPEELFARAYEQWIALRLPAGHPLKRQLTDYLRQQQATAWFWSDDDFDPIAAAMDAIFRERGWLIKTP